MGFDGATAPQSGQVDDVQSRTGDKGHVTHLDSALIARGALQAAGLVGTSAMGDSDGSAKAARDALNSPGSTGPAFTASMIERVAKDELSFERETEFNSDSDKNSSASSTTIVDQMARLNENFREMRAAIKAMTADSGKDGMNIKATWDGQNPTSVTFEIPGTDHYRARTTTVSLLNEKDERNVRRMASLLTNSPGPMTYDHLHEFANIVKSYGGNDRALEKMYDNLCFEAKQAGIKSPPVGLSFKDQKLDSLMVFGRHNVTYFRLDGTISMRDPAEMPSKPQ